MSNDAIQNTDVSTEGNDNEKKVKPQLDTAHFDYLEAIAKHNEEIEKQSEIDLAAAEGREPASWALETDETTDEEEITDEEKRKKEEELEDDSERETETERQAADEAAEQAKEKQRKAKKLDLTDEELESYVVKIKVDGVESEIPLSKIKDAGVRTLQKESAADSRLEEAVKLLKEVKELAASKPSSDASKVSTKQETITDESLNELKENYLHAATYGTEEEAASALSEWEEAMEKKYSAPKKEESSKGTVIPFSKDDIKKAILETTLESRINSSPEDGGFKDLMDNPILRKHTGALVDSLVESGKGSYDSFETYQQAGEAIRQIGSTLDPEYTPPKVDKKTKSNLQTRKERKKAIDNINSATGKVDSSAEDDKEETISETLQEMKKARGQAI